MGFYSRVYVPPTSVIRAENAIPSMKRHTNRVPMFCATAQGMMKMTAIRSVLAYTFRRPRISLKGAKTMGPTPKPITKSVTESSAASSLTLKLRLTPAMSAVMTELLNATTKQVMATVMVHHHLYAFDQFLGFAGSPGVKVTSSYRSVRPVLFDNTVCRPVGVSAVYSFIRASRVRVR